MRTKRIKLSVSTTIYIPVASSEDDAFQELIDEIEDNTPPPWIEEMIKESITSNDLRDIEIISLSEASPDIEEEYKELNFDL